MVKTPTIFYHVYFYHVLFMMPTSLSTPDIFLHILRAVLLVCGMMLCLDAAVLFYYKKINFGTVVPFVIGLVFLLHAIYWHSLMAFLSQHAVVKLLWQLAWAGFVVWLLSFIYFVYTLQQQLNAQKHLPDVSAIIVLGSGIIDGQPTPALASRLDRAVPIIQAQPNAVVVVTGGVGIGHTQSEASVMARYLHDQHGIAMADITQEGDSTSTELNLANSKPLLQAQNISLSAPIAIVTNDFHTIRARAIAHKQGYEHVVMVASDTPLSIRYNAWFREYFAFISGWILQEY